MSRSVPWRSKPTPLILEMIQAAKQYKLYLISETGPFSFVFKDDNENKFKVSIGSVLKCSCGVMTKDHCIHTIFVLLKRFKVDENNPIIWQPSYLDSQLEGLMSFKYSKKVKPVVTVKKNNLKKNEADDNQSEISEIGEDQTCPICYMDLKQQCFSTCTQCKNHLHSKCFKIWIKHKLQTNDKVTCPLCRNPFMNPLGIVARDLERWAKKFTIHKGTKCQGCGVKNISGDIYHCVICQHLNLCKYCYTSNQHNVHDNFLTKSTAKQAWRIAKPRGSKTSKKYLQPEKQIQVNQPTQFQLIQFLVSSIPTIKQFHNLQLNSGASGLGIIGNQMKAKTKNQCKGCNELGNDQMKKLNCGHIIHDFCLIKMYEGKKYYCPCGEPVLHGYLSALGLKPKKVQVQKVQKQKQKEKSQDFGLRIGNSKPPLMQKPKMNHFRVRKSSNDKRPIVNNELMFQISNMPIRQRSLLK